MKLLILGLADAVNYIPTDLTYAIRIDSELIPFGSDFALQDSDLYTITQYVFDDRTPHEGDGKLLEEKTASQLIDDFKHRGLHYDTLLVHCIMAKNRSPAVGMALNDIFKIGYNLSELQHKYPDANKYIYETLITAAKKIL
ncbi:MAG: hypothetical protein Q8R37_04665 [Nanoarchaeota archaeon]|nr:hypothetical protein [Nanoarchaeota archaeon]